jgi:hypothetical protein
MGRSGKQATAGQSHAETIGAVRSTIIAAFGKVAIFHCRLNRRIATNEHFYPT